MEEVQFWAEKLTKSDFTVKLDLFSEESFKTDDLKKRLEKYCEGIGKIQSSHQIRHGSAGRRL